MTFKTKKFQLLLLVFAWLIPLVMTAQNMLWEKDLKEQLYKVNWIEQTDDGMLIAAGDKGLLALDNNTGETVWHNKDLKAVNRNSFQKIEGLPLFTIETSPLVTGSFASHAVKSLILNSSTGEIVFNSKDEALNIGNYHLLPSLNSILFEAKQKDRNKLLLFNYETTQTLWVMDVSERDKGVKGFLKNAIGIFAFLSELPAIIDNQKMLIVENRKVHAINYQNGEILWSKPFKKKIKSASYSSVNQRVYVGIKEKLQVFDVATGEDVTSGKMKLNGSFVDVFTNEENNIVIVSTNGFNILDPQTEKFLWKKPFGISGLYDVIDMGDYYLAIGSEEKSSSVAKVSKAGKKIWREKLSGFAYHVQPIEKGIFYLSTEKSNILTYEEGEKIWKKDIKFKAIPAVAVDQKNQEVIFYEGKELYRFSLNSGDIETLAEGIKFEKSKGAVFELESRPNGYFLFSDQHISFFDKHGKSIYNSFYKPVSNIELASAIALTAKVAGVDLDIAGSIETIKALDAISHGAYMDGGDQNENKSSSSSAGLFAATASGGSAPILAVTKTRFFNSRQAKNHNYILTNLNGKNHIVMVNKENGNIDKKILLEDKTPSYITDEIDQRVFLNEKNRMVRCYDMK